MPSRKKSAPKKKPRNEVTSKRVAKIAALLMGLNLKDGPVYVGQHDQTGTGGLTMLPVGWSSILSVLASGLTQAKDRKRT